ncbi:hypothetical protein K7472_30400 [Streptomyces sp. PTM05]|uniref:Uncharacterized protein n=1 Tax=Streptantibioticus parmotrematis TaxID=2873249 RepID=A0ABS7R0Y1_9ACTN|nr:hypothetical protein [Streptantibioticus parmotrematis]MBY8889123.1 hypothetical protein [Streptantibioticus parmotrematis]
MTGDLTGTAPHQPANHQSHTPGNPPWPVRIWSLDASHLAKRCTPTGQGRRARGQGTFTPVELDHPDLFGVMLMDEDGYRTSLTGALAR